MEATYLGETPDDAGTPREGKRRLVLAAAACSAVALAGGLAYGLAPDGTPTALRARSSAVAAAEAPAPPAPDAPAPEAAGGAPELPPLPPVPPGKTAIRDKVGRFRGFVDSAVLFSMEPRPAGGVPVHSPSGELTGYIVEQYGFLDAVSAADPKIVAALKANPAQVVDEIGATVSFEEWARRVAGGTARTR